MFKPCTFGIEEEYFITDLHTRDMPAYLALAQRLFTSSANVRNVKAFFSVKRAKFDPRIPLSGGLQPSPAD